MFSKRAYYITAGLIGTLALYKTIKYIKKASDKSRTFKYNDKIVVKSINDMYGGTLKNDSDTTKYTFILNINNESIKHIKDFVNFILLNVKTEEKLIINVESPGGNSDLFFNALEQLDRLTDYTKFVFVDKIACSGGYLLALIGNKIYTTKYANLGSIGVFTESVKYNELLKKIGVDSKLIYSNKDKINGSSSGERSEEEDNEIKKYIDESYNNFKNEVVNRRKNVKEEALTGKHYCGGKSIELGLADEIMHVEDFLMNESKDHYLVQIKYKKNKESNSLLSYALKFLTAKISKNIKSFFN